ncbi:MULTISPECIES: serine/threonine-protein kinase [Calothrix]|uniref:non-specific serine/threonine protein kinase n=2 Tax=Calothrix TaxID=1186 RepID=A0ABR8A8D4_9CYAN|nr:MULTISPECIES: serine/threonine-protein kinase [Calothrix]MBD2195311.1 protein kinase [Calothrix parietina FACHB-288]MBD2223910.1 protein kinase [Calothrix anomala FACHB-343]
MPFSYCSQGHENPAGSRFCLTCGEKLSDTPINYNIQAGQVLGDRYLIVRQIGQGGFGRTYLAEDINRFRELCVLKEFSPQVQTAYVLQKAEELFQREASVLYQLQHPQIPRFRENFRINLAGKEYLFLVQDYVEGQAYNSLLNNRLKQNMRFTEAEIRQLLQQILPVLEYIHALGVIHRDISPDNLILRQADQLPVLIDFGGVKQVVAAVASQYYQPGVVASPPAATLLGKVGFAPPEQMQTGLVSPHSDLYALAATMLVLLTGKQPQELIDTYSLDWQWQREVSLSPSLAELLNKMLSPRPGDRYQSARQVLELLNQPQGLSYIPTQPPTQAPPPAPIPQPHQPTTATETIAISSPRYPTPSVPVASPPPPPGDSWTSTKTLLVGLATAGVVGLGVWGISKVINPGDPGGGGISASPTPTATNNPPQYSPEEQARKDKLRDRRQQLGIDNDFFVKLVNQLFWEKNPSLTGRTLSDRPEDESLRAEWDKLAGDILTKLAPLSNKARQQLSTYTTAERDRWKVAVNQINVGSRSLYDLGDAAFFATFPTQRGKEFIDQPTGQVWYAFVSDKLNAILANSAFGKITFDAGSTSKTVSGKLSATNGKVFIADLAKEQALEVNLKANNKVLLSIYSPSGKIAFLEDSTKRTLSTTLPEAGFYEFVVVNTASSPADYQLTINAESPTPIPSPTPTVTETPTPSPSPTATPSPSPTPSPTVTPSPTPTPSPTATPSP